MEDARVMYFLNQFFAGIGAEEKADTPLDARRGALGPGKRFELLLGENAPITVTVSCGDNYFASHRDEVLQKLSKIARDEKITIVVAGPAFLAGRYGFACTEICHALSDSLGLYCVTAMHIENAGVVGYREYKDKKVFLFPTSDVVKGMEDALSRMAKFVLKLCFGHSIGPASEEGYLPRGIRLTEVTGKVGAERAVDMLMAKLSDQPFVTEIPVITEEVTPIAPSIRNMEKACLAIVTTSGVVGQGNPDKFKAVSNTKWGKYSIHGLKDMKEGKWDVVHSGYDTVYMNADPNYGVPLDMVRQFEASQELEKGGRFARLYPYFYSSTGVGGVTSVMQHVGKEMAQNMKSEGIDGAILVSTWGSDSHSGAVIAKEIERAGIPVAVITPISLLGKQTGASRVVAGVKVPNPCGDPELPPESDRALRKELIACALESLQTEVKEPTIFTPKVVYTRG